MSSTPQSGPVVVRESAAQRNGLFAFLAVVFAAALARGVLGAATMAGRIAVIVIMGGVLVLILVLWVTRRQAKQWPEVSADSIVLRQPKVGREEVLRRTSDSRLRFTAVGAGRARQLALQIEGADDVLALQFFKQKKVEAACVTCGWIFA